MIPTLLHVLDAPAEFPDIPQWMIDAAHAPRVHVRLRPASEWAMPKVSGRISPSAKDRAARELAAAVANGASTFQQITKATPQMSAKLRRIALRKAIRLRLVSQDGRRYSRI